MTDQNASDLEIEKLIDAYINGNLSDEEAESLWVQLIKHPEYLDHLETEIALKEMIQKKKDSDSVSTKRPDRSE
ncbi:MAG: hypothetical protein R3211_10270, partial [Balneolaceae bacterium]|nr:hypothetical protein [Balneolaceae bacterium]